MGARLLQLLHRLGSRGAATRGDPNVAAAREALLQTGTHLWEQQKQQQPQHQQQQQQQQQQQKQAAHTLLQVVSRLESLPANVLIQLPKQLHSVRLHRQLQQQQQLLLQQLSR